MALSTGYLLSKYSLRAHFWGLLLVVSLAGAGVSRLLLAFGFTALVARTAVCLCVSYALFFFCARFWLHVIASDTKLLDEVAQRDHDSVAPPRISSPSSSSSAGDWLWWIDTPDADFAAFLLGLVALIALLAGAAWLVTEGPVILLDVAFDFALAGGLVRGLRKAPSEGWASVLFRRSIVPFLILLAVNLIAVEVAHEKCPGNDRLSTMVRECNQKSGQTSLGIE